MGVFSDKYCLKTASEAYGGFGNISFCLVMSGIFIALKFAIALILGTVINLLITLFAKIFKKTW